MADILDSYIFKIRSAAAVFGSTPYHIGKGLGSGFAPVIMRPTLLQNDFAPQCGQH
jgi:hypothetical protein